MKELLKNWEWKKLGDERYFKRYGGGTPSKSNNSFWEEGDIPWLSNSELDEGKINYVASTNKKITCLGLENSSATMIPINSVLLTCTASIGKVAINSIPLATNQQFNSFQCFKEILPKYLAYYFLIIKGRLTKISGKTSFLHITIGNLNKIEIPVPPLPIQRKIVSILERAEKLKNLRQEANDETNTIIQSLFYEMFGDPIKNEKNFSFAHLSEVSKINPKKSELEGMPEDTNVSFLPMANVGEKGEIFKEEERKLKEVIKGFTYFRKNEVLFAKITPCMENGKGAIAKIKNEIGFGSTEFHVFRPTNQSNPQWIYFLLSLSFIRKYAKNNMTGTAGQKRVPASFFEKLKIAVPPIALQNQFASLVEKIESIKEKQTQSTEEINTLFDALMQKAFNGELA